MRVNQSGPFAGKEMRQEAEERRLHHLDFGPIERVVRALIGLPVAFVFVYERHFSLPWAFAFLIVGLYLLFTSIGHYCAIRHLVYWWRWRSFRE